ncbi:cytochrome P450 [Streptomyces griseocarneus]|uniref:cytochrome P450 n=1 Tax=Streptomyces griseocarneus TaxID=51201 RepID=UPI00167CB92A|nr:cytochrome P450 [Streptomyces griseocarneus]MBZ6476802.1 cytochrome P450 [Streptomyces griseocarneus]GHG81356.1 cytochrome P450 [Streptomyces griseocarneus]
MTDSQIGAFPYPRTCPMQPPKEYASLRAEQPISKVTLASGRTAWLLTRHEHIRQLLASPDVSSNMAHPGYPLHFDIPAEVMEQMRPVMLAMDPPVHTAQRKMVIPEFTVKRVLQLRPRIQEIVDECISAMLAGEGPVDLVEALALPVPSLAISELLGVPYADRAFFQDCSKKIVSVDTDPQERNQAHQDLQAYFAELITAKEADPGDDLLSRLVLKNRETSTLDHAGLVGMANVLLVGGFETTANMISLGVVGLLENPDQLAKLTADPALAPQAVDELLRYFSIADQVTSRVMLEDIEIGGVLIRAGEGVIGLSASANFDEDVYPDPDRLDIDRGGKHHLAFGHGIHQCIGQNLAKMELEVVFTTLFARIPGLKLAAPVAELPFKDSMGVYGLHRLPVAW